MAALGRLTLTFYRSTPRKVNPPDQSLFHCLVFAHSFNELVNILSLGSILSESSPLISLQVSDQDSQYAAGGRVVNVHGSILCSGLFYHSGAPSVGRFAEPLRNFRVLCSYYCSPVQNYPVILIVLHGNPVGVNTHSGSCYSNIVKFIPGFTLCFCQDAK